MTREEGIKCASKDYVNYLLDKQEYHNEDYTEDDIRQAFEKGAMFADNNPDLSSLWHDASEEPKEEEFILLEVINTRSEGDEVKYFIEYSRKWVVDSMKTEGFKCRWVYVKDLLPKGGEQ